MWKQITKYNKPICLPTETNTGVLKENTGYGNNSPARSELILDKAESIHLLYKL
jgi:hypothetical protein